jgi:hypothetical protein
VASEGKKFQPHHLSDLAENFQGRKCLSREVGPELTGLGLIMSTEELTEMIAKMLKELGDREGVALTEMFEAIDFDGSGTINRAEFTQVTQNHTHHTH